MLDRSLSRHRDNGRQPDGHHLILTFNHGYESLGLVLAALTLRGRTLVNMSRSVEVLHEGRWVPATLLDTRLDPDGWHGLVGYSDPITRQGYYHWCPKAQLRRTPGQVDEG